MGGQYAISVLFSMFLPPEAGKTKQIESLQKGLIFMRTINGYYDGDRIVMDGSPTLSVGQKVMVIVLGNGTTKEEKDNKPVDLERYFGACKGLLHGMDAQEYVNQLRANDRI